MPLYRDSNFLVVHPGSDNTIFSFGLQDSLSPPQYKIPSVVYQNSNTKEFKSKKESEEYKEVRPIVKGKIVDVDGLNYLLKVILQSVINENPIITINQIPLLLIVPSNAWSREKVEYVVKYVLEELEFTAFNIIDLSLAANFGVGVSTSSCVVNVGRETTQVMPVIGSRPVKFAGRYIARKGGNLINQEIQKLLPDFSPEQVEALKCSGIYEVLNTQENNFYSFSDLNNTEDGAQDGNFDVAKVIAQEEEEEVKEEEDGKEEQEKPNRELEINTFADPVSGEKIEVKKERFQGTSVFVNAIAEAIFETLSLVPDLEKRQECYDNIILAGSTFKIPGLKQAVLSKLHAEYLVRPPSENGKDENPTAVHSAIATYQQADDVEDTNGEGGFVLSQVPSSIKLVKYPEYFPEWKKPKETGGSWEDVYFLGAEIYAKQIFSGNSNHGGELFVDNDVYEEKGPQGLWDVVI
ncbi:Piso0_001464 [Millerozyma farinosa CBS 7064]|uniref:Piso0_001464 protein n=1 Tax=Pichia sorbitophila (strain ATCC MYA-4447 / BCRC 22081 / CBS 7064 / NBRC 10061 / NRRL Y-12695) TaxID=559304 RepID=G8YN86_PICSO|nr:Piso0_001464 [Millerozyma farinosa CBS 7064]